MQIQIKQSELEAYNMLDGEVKKCLQEVQRITAARDSFINLLEVKYQATFNPQTGMLEKPDPVKEE